MCLPAPSALVGLIFPDCSVEIKLLSVGLHFNPTGPFTQFLIGKPPAGLEPATYYSTDSCSNPLSYGGLILTLTPPQIPVHPLECPCWFPLRRKSAFRHARQARQ